MFNGRRLIIATKHQKEKVIAPLLEIELGVKCFVSPDIDRDIFGTFTGEIERLNDPIETARQKCLKAIELSGCDMAVSSEGSFGSHPTLFFVNADSEIIMLVDKKNNLEFISREISTQTNFNGTEIRSYKELYEFAKSIQFPSHGLILRKSKENKEDIFKGITTAAKLKEAYYTLMDKFGETYVETDMRAMYNPTRMKVIEKATKKLIEKLKSQCPKCKMPGFSITGGKAGLLCENCGAPTRSTLLHVLNCQSCDFSSEKLYPNGKKFEDPMYCDICNP
ncbi:MAG: hypothetical protein H0U95_12640 [Bacteroidetes bacterium]|nr:hypothetical protein [Bacteroidota bacterium]